MAGGRTQTINRSICSDSGAGSITKIGGGTLLLMNGGAQNSNFTGGVSLQGGTVRIYNDLALGAANTTVTFSNDPSLSFGATFSLSARPLSLGTGGGTIATFGAFTATVPGVVSGNALTFNGTGTLVLSNNSNSFNGMNIAGGTVNISNNGQLGTAAGAINFSNNGILNVTSTLSLTSSRTVTLGVGGGTINTPTGIFATIAGPLTGATNLNLTNIALGATGTTVFSGTTKAYSGTIVINASTTLRTDTANVMSSTVTPTGDVQVLAGGTFLLNNNSQVIRNLSGAGTITSGTGTLTVASSTPTTFSGAISGSAGFIKSGASSLTLSGNNTYTNGTTINNGTLRIVSSDIGGSRNLGATGTFAVPVNLNISGGGTLAFQPAIGAMALDVGRLINLSGAGGGVSTIDTKTITIPGRITGSGGFTYTGGGLSGIFIPSNVAAPVNDYTGGTTLASAVTVQITQENQLGAVGNINMSGASTLAIQPGGAALSLNAGRIISLSGTGGRVSTLNAKTITLPQRITGSGGFTYVGAGGVTTGTFVPSNTTLGSLNNYTGGTSLLSSVTVVIAQDDQLGATGSFAAPVNLNISDGSTLSFQPVAATMILNSGRLINLSGTGGRVSTSNGKTITIPGRISGTGGLTYIGGGASGTFIPSNTSGGSPNSYTGGTTITNAATVQVLQDAQLGNAAAANGITFNNGTLVMTGSFNSSRNVIMTGNGTLDVAAFNPSFDGLFSGAGILTKLGTGELKLKRAGANTNTGGFIVSAGTLTGNTNTLKGPITNNSHVIIDQSITGAPIAAGLYTSVMSGTGDLVVKATSNVTLTAANTFQGGTTVQTGTLLTNAANRLPPAVNNIATAGAMILQGTSILNLNSFSQTIGDLTGAVGTAINIGTATFSVGSQMGAIPNSGITTTMAGNITGTGGLGPTATFIKKGNSKLVLTGTFNPGGGAGHTEVQGGTLTLTSPGLISSGGVTRIYANSTLEINGGNVVGGITGGTGIGPLATGTLLITSTFTPTGAAIQFMDTITVGPAGNVTYGIGPPTFNTLNVNGNGSNALLTVNTPLTVAAGKVLNVQGSSPVSTGTVDLVLGGLTNAGGTVNVLPNGIIKSSAIPQQSFVNNGILNLAGGLITCPIVGGGIQR